MSLPSPDSTGWSPGAERCGLIKMVVRPTLAPSRRVACSL